MLPYTLTVLAESEPRPFQYGMNVINSSDNEDLMIRAQQQLKDDFKIWLQRHRLSITGTILHDFEFKE